MEEICRSVVLLTDGLNTQNRWSSKPISNGRRAITCANIKAANVDLYTI